VLKAANNVNMSEYVHSHGKRMAGLANFFNVTHEYSFLAQHGFPAYSANLSPEAVKLVLEQEDVDYVEQDAVVRTQQTCLSQGGATWGLVRIASHPLPSYSSPYTYTASGSGATVYVLDTGIYCENRDFTSKTVGRCYNNACVGTANANCGKSFITNETPQDGNGHGTHCASTISGFTYGVAKSANVVAVKVLSNQGSGSSAGVNAGMDWAAKATTGTRGVLSMSLGGGYSKAQNDAVTAVTNAGRGVIVAAGNDNANAVNYSPASAPDAYAVGASTSTDTRSSFSNFGTPVKIFAPGSSITAAWIGSITATNTISGTSMACPHVAGAAAKLIGNSALSPSSLYSSLSSASTKNVVSNAGTGSTNQLLYSGC
jgi:serine protease